MTEGDRQFMGSLYASLLYLLPACICALYLSVDKESVHELVLQQAVAATLLQSWHVADMACIANVQQSFP